MTMNIQFYYKNYFNWSHPFDALTLHYIYFHIRCNLLVCNIDNRTELMCIWPHSVIFQSSKNIFQNMKKQFKNIYSYIHESNISSYFLMQLTWYRQSITCTWWLKYYIITINIEYRYNSYLSGTALIIFNILFYLENKE